MGCLEDGTRRGKKEREEESEQTVELGINQQTVNHTPLEHSGAQSR